MDERKLAGLLQRLEATSQAYAQAKGDQVRLEKFTGIVKAQQMQAARDSGEAKSVAAAEIVALASDEYVEACTGYSIATEQAIKLDWELRIAQWRIELTRTIEATRRTEMKAFS